MQMEWLECGRITNTHGVRGELKAENYCDEGLFQSLKQITVGGTEYHLISSRAHGAFVLLTLRGIDTVEAAMPLKGKAITVRRDSIHLKQGEYFYQDLYGFQVFDLRRNAVIGTLAEVLERPASMLYRITGPLGEILIPAVEPFRREIRLEDRQIVVSTIEGMLPDEN